MRDGGPQGPVALGLVFRAFWGRAELAEVQEKGSGFTFAGTEPQGAICVPSQVVWWR